MSEWSSRFKSIIDNHVHMGGMANEIAMLRIMDATGIEKMSLVSIQDPASGSGLAGSLYMKARHPKQYYVMPALNHQTALSAGRVQAAPRAAQVDTFVAIGCDGLKMVEGKPTSRQAMNIPVTDAYFADYWAHVEELGLPIVWHVNDPEEFWEPDKLPAWARELKWGYGPEDVQKEQLYAEVAEVLARHPRLKVIFPHFYFLSADLPRAGRFLDEHPNVSFDLAPGIEYLYNLSRDPDASRAFFVRYAERILYGTDLMSQLTVDQGRYRAGIIYRWLETEDTFRIPAGVDFLLGKPEDGVIRGMALPDDVLAKIYGGNFTRLVGPAPKPLDRDAAMEELQREAIIAAGLSGKAPASTEAARVAGFLAAR